MGKKRVIVSVTNDLATDARVDKVCRLLTSLGFEVLLVGRMLNNSLPVNGKPHKTKRFKLLFNKGPLFYAEYNLRLFFFLLFQPKSILVANDLDTLLPNTIISRWKKTPLVYDSHEYYTGVPELEGRPRVQKIWKRIERYCIPKLKYCITVNQSIANLYYKEYGVKFEVVRNVPEFINSPPAKGEYRDHGRGEGVDSTKENVKTIILQGAGINIDRGAEELLQAMQHLGDEYHLLIIGGGDVFEKLKAMRVELELEDKVTILGKMPSAQLMEYTASAGLGATLDKPLSTNYLYSLPNKIFDYIHAGIPVLSSDLPELRKIIEQYNVGVITPSHKPEDIAASIEKIFADKTRYAELKANTAIAAAELNWENESVVLKNIYSQFNT